MPTDWSEVAKRNPKGFLSIQTAGDVTVHGPVKQITIDEKTKEVIIEVEWFVYGKGIEIEKIPADSWAISFDKPFVVTKFPNGSVPYVIQSTPEQGDVVVFSGQKKKRTLCFDYFEVIPLLEIAGFKDRIFNKKSVC